MKITPQQWEKAKTLFEAALGVEPERRASFLAGACADETTLPKAVALGLHWRAFLNRHDAYSFFEQAGGLIKTGLTLTIKICKANATTFTTITPTVTEVGSGWYSIEMIARR